MKSFFNNLVNSEIEFEKIDFNSIINKKENIFIVLSKDPFLMIEQIENTFYLGNLFNNQFYITDEYYYIFLENMKKLSNHKIYEINTLSNIPPNSIFINFDSQSEIERFIQASKDTIFFDINNRGNFIIKPQVEDYKDILNVFYTISNISPEKSNFKIDYPEKNRKEKNEKLKLIFDIQNSINGKAVDILLKNLQNYPDLELYLIWRTGSVDFDYSHLDTENFYNYYQAARDADIFFTDDKVMWKFLKKLNLTPVFLGKKNDKDELIYNPKNIFDIKNFIFSKRDE